MSQINITPNVRSKQMSVSLHCYRNIYRLWDWLGCRLDSYPMPTPCWTLNRFGHYHGIVNVLLTQCPQYLQFELLVVCGYWTAFSMFAHAHCLLESDWLNRRNLFQGFHLLFLNRVERMRTGSRCLSMCVAGLCAFPYLPRPSLGSLSPRYRVCDSVCNIELCASRTDVC